VYDRHDDKARVIVAIRKVLDSRGLQRFHIADWNDDPDVEWAEVASVLKEAGL
jgi:hypothetical protein